MEAYLTIYWCMVGFGGAALAFLSLTGHLHLGGEHLHLGGHGGLDLHAPHADLHAGHAAGPGGHAVPHGVDQGGAHAAGPAEEFVGAFGCLNPFIFATFVTFGGVAGVALDAGGLVGAWSLPPALGCGLLMAWMTMFGFNTALQRLQGTSSFRGANVIGFEAEVITPIPAHGMGEIAFTVKIIRRTAPARSEDATEIPRDVRVTILDQDGPCYVVRPTDRERLRMLDPESGADSSRGGA